MLASPAVLHIPDGFLTPLVAAVGWLAAIAAILLATTHTRRQFGERMAPMMGILAAFIFAAQAINFPVAAGTSGHLLGAALAAIVVGPWGATLILTAVVVVQGLLFQDGGLVVMGWNIINLGVVAAFSAGFIFRLTRRWGGGSRRATLAAAFAAAWISVMAAALATAIELALSGTAPLPLAVTAMASVHAVIGLGEGVITMAAIGLLLTTRPAVLSDGMGTGERQSSFLVAGLLLALLVAAFSPLASTNPDGLESVARSQGFLGLEQSPPVQLLPGYAIPSLADPAAATVLAVMLGTLVVFVTAVVAGRVGTRRNRAKG